jgi:hypothetical protein
MRTPSTRLIVTSLLVISSVTQPSIAFSDNLPAKTIIEGGECSVLNEQAPLANSWIKVTCVEKDKKLIWTSNPEVYKQLSNIAPITLCNSECQIDRQGIAQGEVEAADAKTYFPKWVTDAQSYFSNLVLKKIKSAFGEGTYTYISPMPTPSADSLVNPSIAIFGSYKMVLRDWSEAELIGLNQSRFQSSASQDTVNDKKNLPNSSIQLVVDKNSNGKFLIAVYSNVIEKPVSLKASKNSSKQISILVQTDSYGYGSILTSQKLSGYKLSAIVNAKVKTSTTVK